MRPYSDCVFPETSRFCINQNDTLESLSSVMERRRGIDLSDALKDVATVEEYERIFERYLDVCNQAIEKNKNKFPYTEIWGARWKHRGLSHILQCAVYDDRPKIVYTLQLTDDIQIKVIEKTRVTPGNAWPLQYCYLQRVVDNPGDYIEHPTKLDWGWLSVL